MAQPCRVRDDRAHARRQPPPPAAAPAPPHRGRGRRRAAHRRRRDPRPTPRSGATRFALEIGGGAVRIRHGAGGARRYAEETLRQIRAQSRRALPPLRIDDAPDFPVRGLMLDVSRDRVPTRETLARLVELLARLRLNHLELYTEHTFAYRGHEAVWRDASPLTPDDVRWLDALCRERDIELCANQNMLRPHGALARAPGLPRARRGAGRLRARSSASRCRPACSRRRRTTPHFALGLCRELLACHTSRRIHIGCDETFELGRGAEPGGGGGARPRPRLSRPPAAPAAAAPAPTAARCSSGATSCAITRSWCPSCRAKARSRAPGTTRRRSPSLRCRTRCSRCSPSSASIARASPASRRTCDAFARLRPALLGVPGHVELELADRPPAERARQPARRRRGRPRARRRRLPDHRLGRQRAPAAAERRASRRSRTARPCRGASRPTASSTLAAALDAFVFEDEARVLGAALETLGGARHGHRARSG